MIEVAKSIPADGRWYPIHFARAENVDLARARRRLADVLRPLGRYETTLDRPACIIHVRHLPPSEA
ncbi:MAG TPA: hypothetical protein DEH78_19065 [Solibacterales bacterium]|nr:hypothetical protein [Bryobacterales bacterium]